MWTLRESFTVFRQCVVCYEVHIFPVTLLHVNWLRINGFVIHHKPAHQVIYFGEVCITTANTNIAHISVSRWSLVWSNCGVWHHSNTCGYHAQLIRIWEPLMYFCGYIVFWRLETFWCVINACGIVNFRVLKCLKQGWKTSFMFLCCA